MTTIHNNAEYVFHRNVKNQNALQKQTLGPSLHKQWSDLSLLCFYMCAVGDDSECMLGCVCLPFISVVIAVELY